MGFGRFEFIGSQVKIYCFEKSFVSNKIAKHMQYAAPFIVTNCVKHVFFILVMKTYKVFVLAATLQIPLHITIVLRITCIFAIFIFIPQCFTVVGKRFIECQVAPAFSSNIITKPLMK